MSNIISSRSRCCWSAAAATKEARIGLPATTDLRAGNSPSGSGKDRKIRSTKFARIRFVTPGMAFCSAMAVLIPRKWAVRTAGPEAYPPTPRTTWGENFFIILNACIILFGIFSAAWREFPQERPLMPSTSSVARGYPSSGRTRFSSPRSVPTKSTSWRRSRFIKASATATPGKRCPPVPPPAMIIFTVFSPHCSWAEMLSRMPTMVRLMMRDVPP